jgi:hypothetical protein
LVDAQTAKLALNRKLSSIKYGCQTSPRSRTIALELVRTFTCAFNDTDPLDQPGSLTVAELWNRVRRSLRFRVAMSAQELPFHSTQISGSQGSPFQLRVEVTGMYLNRDSMRPR